MSLSAGCNIKSTKRMRGQTETEKIIPGVLDFIKLGVNRGVVYTTRFLNDVTLITTSNPLSIETSWAIAGWRNKQSRNWLWQSDCSNFGARHLSCGMERIECAPNNKTGSGLPMVLNRLKWPPFAGLLMFANLEEQSLRKQPFRNQSSIKRR